MADVAQLARQSFKEMLAAQLQSFRDVVQGLDAEALNWTPGPETNSIAVLVVHSLGSTQSGLAAVVQEPTERDRDAEFRASAATADDLLRQIDDIESRVNGWIDRISETDLTSERTRPSGTAATTRLGIRWLFSTIEHNREHIGQALLTRQLYEQRG